VEDLLHALELAASQFEGKTEFISTSTNVYDLKSIKKFSLKRLHEFKYLGSNIHDSEKDLILKKILKSGKPSRGKSAIDIIEFGYPISQLKVPSEVKNGLIIFKFGTFVDWMNTWGSFT